MGTDKVVFVEVTSPEAALTRESQDLQISSKYFSVKIVIINELSFFNLPLFFLTFPLPF
jgi:hypothetical protein